MSISRIRLWADADLDGGTGSDALKSGSMQEYLQIVQLILPVFAVLGCGILIRKLGWLNESAESGIVALVVKLFYPCLVIKSMIQADSFRDSVGSLWAPVVGFGTVAFGFLVGGLVAKAIGFEKGKGLRTFAFSVGIYNYGYIPIPLMENMFGANELAVLFVHNVGIEVAIWTVGVSFLAGGSLKSGIKKILNPMVIALVIGLILNISGWGTTLPRVASETLFMFASCAIPLGLLAIGANLFDHISSGEKLWDTRDCIAAVVLRLGFLPLVGLAIAWLLPLSIELKRVLVFQAAMPAGIMPIVLAKHYGGHPIVAVRVVFASTIVGLATMPLWIRYGLELIGGM